jgi:2Fe-2S ferredoxin
VSNKRAGLDNGHLGFGNGVHCGHLLARLEGEMLLPARRQGGQIEIMSPATTTRFAGPRVCRSHPAPQLLEDPYADRQLHPSKWNEGGDREIAAGLSVMQGATNQSVNGIVGECGGNAMCATCHVYVEPAQFARLPPMGADEDAVLDSTASERRPNSRLSCQIVVTPELDGLTVHLPVRQVRSRCVPLS